MDPGHNYKSGEYFKFGNIYTGTQNMYYQKNQQYMITTFNMHCWALITGPSAQLVAW